MYLTQGLHRALQRSATKTALTHIGESVTRDHSFSTLVDGVARHAAALVARGIRANDRVAILCTNHDLMVQSLFACWWIGAVACPLNHRWSAPELRDAVADCGASILVFDANFAPLAQQVPVPQLSIEALDSEAQTLKPLQDLRAGGDTLAAILYTGGTTGRSKGVMLTHANFWAASMARGAELNSSPDSISLLVAPFFHVAGLGRLIGQVIVGGSCVTMAQFRPASVLAVMHDYAITDTIMVPTMLQALLDEPSFHPTLVQSLNRIAFGAAPMPPALLDRALSAWPNAEFFQAYGLTETAGAVCINLPENHRSPEARTNGLVNSVGRAGLGAEILIVDEFGTDVPRGEVGEIVVRGPMVTQAYWDNAAATNGAFRDGWFRTGDAGVMDHEGYLFVVDRLKDMIITGGENVYCAEVEAVLSRHPKVSQVAVIGLADAHWGETVHAVVVLTEQADDELKSCAELREWCRERLAGYKCPRSISFTNALPLSAAGKVLKNVLRSGVEK